MKIHKNKNGQDCKALYIKFLEMEYWQILQEIKTLSGSTSDAAAIRWSLKRATNRV